MPTRPRAGACRASRAWAIRPGCCARRRPTSRSRAAASSRPPSICAGPEASARVSRSRGDNQRVDPLNESLFDAQALESPADLASSLAPPAAPGHFDELRGLATPTPSAVPRLGMPSQPAPLHDAASPPPPTAARPEPEAAERGPLAPHWADFFEQLGTEGFSDLPRRAISLERQIRDNGVTYNVYADAGGPQRPWSLDLFPLIVPPESWAAIEAGAL